MTRANLTQTLIKHTNSLNYSIQFHNITVLHRCGPVDRIGCVTTWLREQGWIKI